MTATHKLNNRKRYPNNHISVIKKNVIHVQSNEEINIGDTIITDELKPRKITVVSHNQKPRPTVKEHYSEYQLPYYSEKTMFYQLNFEEERG